MSRGDTQKKEKSLHFSTFNGTLSLFFEQGDLPFHWALHTMQPVLSPITPKWILCLWVLHLPLHHSNFSFSCTVDLNKSYIIFTPGSQAPHIQLPNSAKNTEGS